MTTRARGLDRRGLLLGLTAAGAGLAIADAEGATPQEAEPSAPRPSHEPIEARTADGLTLRGVVQGPPDGLEILFIHGLRQSRLSWTRQFRDPALADFRMAAFDLRGQTPTSPTGRTPMPTPFSGPATSGP